MGYQNTKAGRRIWHFRSMLRSVSASCTSPSWIHTQTPLLTRAGRTFISFSAALRSDNSRAGSRAQGDSNNDSEVYTGVEKDVGGQQFLTSSNGTNADTYTSKETSRSIHHSTLTDLEAARRNRKSEWKRRQGVRSMKRTDGTDNETLFIGSDVPRPFNYYC